MRKLIGFGWILWLLAGCVALPTAPAAQSQTAAVKLGVGFIPNVQFAPFYVGMEKGFFAAEGIDLSLDYGFENDYLKLVGTNDFQFMIGSGDQVVLGRAQGLPVVYVANWYSRYPVTIFALAEANITEPADLAGKAIGVPGPFGATYIALRALLETAGLSEDDIRMESIGFTQAAAVSEGLVDAAADYAVNGPVVLAQEGIETTQIGLDDYVQIPANGLVTNEATLADHPALVASMVRAMMQSVQYTLDHPDEAFEIALKFVPEAGGENAPVNRAVFDASLPYWQPRPDGILGISTAAEWENVAELMVQIGLSETLVDPATLYTNQFVEDAAP